MGNIDLELKHGIDDFNGMNQDLKNYGLELKLVDIPLEPFVIGKSK